MNETVTPATYQGSTLMARKFRAALASGEPIRGGSDEPYKPRPFLYFFYGTLKDPKTLARIAGIEEDEPEMMEAKAETKYLKYWGVYPVLCSGKWGQTVHGVVWKAPTVEVVERLRAYETEYYREQLIRVVLNNGEEDFAKAFVWNGGNYNDHLLSAEPI
jgi:hypothetical protein